MRIAKGWLADWLDTTTPFEDFAGLLTRGGFEVEGAGTVGPPLAEVVVARIVGVRPHPNAERLRVCEVDCGEAEPRIVVCGAPNARAGIAVPLALPGAVAGGRVIEVAELRGVRSQGMLCSGAELGLGATEGLWELPADVKPGRPLAAYLGLTEPYLDVAVTPNRGDCLSVKGMARELAALCGGRFRPPRPRALKTRGVTPRVTVREPARCPRYCARTISGIRTNAQSPAWLVERLRLCGVTARHLAVDVSNYIMFDLGQPLHAFDAALVRGELVVRLAADGEPITLLDGSTRQLTAADLVIADDEGPLAIAGVMGGARAAVHAHTQSLLLEAAYFAPAGLSQTARRLGLPTDAALRFERGVDPALAGLALERATALIQKLGGGDASPAAEHSVPALWPTLPAIRLRLDHVRRLLGVSIPRAQAARFLKALGMTVAASHGDLMVTPPSFRFDVREEIDLVEELARLWGYDEIPAVGLAPSLTAAPRPPSGLRRAADFLVDRDYQEALCFSLGDPAEQAAFQDAPAVRLRNPLAAPWSVLRVSLIPGLLAAALHNRRRQQSRVRLFEIGVCFEGCGPKDGRVHEERRIAGVALGSTVPEQWGRDRRSVDFFDVKGDLEALATLVGRELHTRPWEAPFLQKGVGASVWVDGERIGFLGALALAERRRLGFDEPVFVFEVQAAAFAGARARPAAEPPRFPAVRRDLALVVPATVAAGAVLETARRSAGTLLQDLVLFDVYQGEGLDFGKKSLAMGLTFQDFSRTLTDEVIDEVVARTVAALSAAYGARLRQ